MSKGPLIHDVNQMVIGICIGKCCCCFACQIKSSFFDPSVSVQMPTLRILSLSKTTPVNQVIMITAGCTVGGLVAVYCQCDHKFGALHRSPRGHVKMAKFMSVDLLQTLTPTWLQEFRP